MGVGNSVWKELWITEGERKADYNYFIKKCPTLAIPGVSTWRRVIEWLPSLTAADSRVILALDLDDAGKQTTEQMIEGLGNSYKIARATWEGGKGLDDATGEIRIEPVEQKRSRGANPHYLNNINNVLKPLAYSKILDWIKQHGPILRSRIPCYQPHVSKLIKEGKLKITYSKEGQVIEYYENRM
jgi:hypothetical protein